MGQTEGLYYTICTDTHSILRLGEGRPAMLALSLFCLNQIPELGDTVFLILKRKQVRFLQWYHHAATLLFCWLALATEYTPGIWFAITNYFVHSIMYMYFCLMTFKSLQKILKVIAPFITIIQIADVLGPHCERHRRGLVLRRRFSPDQGSDGLPLRRDVRLLRLALHEALHRL